MTSAQHMTSEGKEALRKTIRTLRESLLSQLKEEAERAYHLGAEKTKLSEERARKRERLLSWADEQSRAELPKGKSGEAKQPTEKQLSVLRQRHIHQAVKEAAHTLLNRLVILRLMEAGKLISPAVVSGGRKSPAYLEFQNYAAALCRDPKDGTGGYQSLLQLVFDELSVELPGVFGKVGLTSLFSVPAALLWEVVEALNNPALDSVWGDDTTLGWVYQFWNDPEREALDDKINGGGKIEPHEIASKTQMFTERYMVEWLLQNSLGQTWLAMCKKHGWTPDFEQVREQLESRRADWRKQREAGAVQPDELMPIQSELEHQWKYWVPQPMPEDAPAAAPERLSDLKLLDPACGSGHFLVIAFDLLATLYQEEARHRGEQVTDAEIAQSVIENNLHGVDIDPRAIQIAAAALWLKAKLFCSGVKVTRMNLVAPTFKLAALPADDAALLELKKRLRLEVGIPESLTTALVAALDGVNHLGTLLRVDKNVRSALQAYEKEFFRLGKGAQIGLFGEEEQKKKVQLTLDEAEASVIDQLAKFLDAHEGASDLGLRLEGEQLAAGVRFLQIVREGTFDVVVGNPPYQGTSKLAAADWFKKHYPRGKADLYACFLERGLELAKRGGVSALLTMRGWMFLSSYQDLREGLLKENDLAVLGDIDRGGFADIPDEVVAASMAVFAKRKTAHHQAIAMQPTPLDDKSRDAGRTSRKKAALLAQVGRFEFDVAKLAGIEGTPLVYWWDEAFLEEYAKAPKLGEVAPARFGLNTGNNVRFLRIAWEPAPRGVFTVFPIGDFPGIPTQGWSRYLKGSAGKAWLDSCDDAIEWRNHGLAVKVLAEHLYGSYSRQIRNESAYWQHGVAFTMIGSEFAARRHRFRCVIDSKGSSVYPKEPADTLCFMNRAAARAVLSSLNPTVSFQVGDVNRLPIFPVKSSSEINSLLWGSFTLHESHREPSVEFKTPGPSPWRYAQAWAQRAVDRPKGEPLPPYEEQLDPPDPTSFVSFAIGVALGRFGENGEGILDLALPPAAKPRAPDTATNNKPKNPEKDDLAVPNIEPSPLPTGQQILPDGILFISAAPQVQDSTSHPAFQRIGAAWAEQGRVITDGKNGSAREPVECEEWLRKDFFSYHKSLYENRPIYFPLSSEKKSFVAWVSIHRWADNTLQSLLAHHLHPAREKLQGEINDLNAARASSDKKQQASAEKQYSKTQKLFEELQQFIIDVTQLAEKGAPPTEATSSKNGCPPREVDAPFKMDLDDGVMINSAALWPLLEPQWKDPKKWWKELCTADGRKDYDWAHLSARYFPTRVDAKCQVDPSLGVAHGCFWKYHPAKAFAWELRLQDEIAPTFTIDEPGSDKYREAFLRDYPTEAAEARAKEEQRRERNRKKATRAADAEEDDGELFRNAGYEDADDAEGAALD